MGVACSEEYKNLRKRHEELTSKISSYEMEQENFHKKIEKLELEENKLKETIKNYEAIKENLNNQLEIERIKNQGKIQRLQNQIDNKKEEVNAYKRRQSQLQYERDNLRNNLDNLQDKNKNMSNQIKNLEKQKSNLNNDINILNTKQENLKKKNEEIELEMKNNKIKLTARIDHLKKEKNKLNDQIDNLKNEKDLNEKEKIELQKQFNNYQNKNKERENELKEQIIYLSTEKDLLNNKIEDLECQKLMAEKAKKENENYKNFLENKINNFITKISETDEINQYVKNKCDNILKSETDKIKDQIIETSIKNSNFLHIIENEKDKEIKKAIEDFTLESKHINIIIIGKTGVGKSELINAIAGSVIAETGGFRPMRHSGTWHEIGSLRIYDNQGIEISKYNTIDNVITNIKEIVDDAKKSGQPDRFVHCIWYCVTGTRFEEDEELAVGKLLDIYEDKCMPIIIVYLRAVSSEWVKNMKNGIDNAFKREIEFVEVLSKDVINDDGTIIKSKGLNSLISKTMNKVKNAIDSQSFVYVINYIKKKVQNLILNKNNQLNVNNNDIINSIINFFNDIIGELSPIAIKLITENINKLQLMCGNAKFDIEILDFVRKFLNSIDYENVNQNDIFKSSLYDKAKIDVENQLKILFNKNLENYINNELNSKIYDFYKIIIKNASEAIVGKNLRNLKKLIISKMKTAIENNPSFQRLFNLSNGS